VGYEEKVCMLTQGWAELPGQGPASQTLSVDPPSPECSHSVLPSCIAMLPLDKNKEDLSLTWAPLHRLSKPGQALTTPEQLTGILTSPSTIVTIPLTEQQIPAGEHAAAEDAPSNKIENPHPTPRHSTLTPSLASDKLISLYDREVSSAHFPRDE